MNLRIKEEYIDMVVSDPLTSKPTCLRDLEPSMYEYYYHNGHSNVFEIVEEKPKKKGKE